MAKITDPDSLNQSTEVIFDPTGKTIRLVVAGNLSTDGVTLQALYSFCKEEWKSDATLIKYAFPIEAITPEQFELINGWDFYDTTTRNLIRDAGWAVNVSGSYYEKYMGFVTLGSVGSSDQIYYLQSGIGNTPSDVVLTGAANQAIKIQGDTNHGNFDYRTFFRTYVREQGKTYATSQLSDIGVTSLTYQVYRFPLSDSTDLKITYADSVIATGLIWTPINITYYNTPQQRTLGSTAYDFNVIISGNAQALERIYEKVQYLLRQSTDIDGGAGTVRGDTATPLLTFVGDTLVTASGVFIDNIQATDKNRIDFYDVTNTKRNYPYTAAGTISFNTNLVNDSSAIYKMFFTTNPAGDYGTASGIIVSGISAPISGMIGGQSSITFDFNYDSNNQGGRTPATDANVTVVAIGLNTAQFVSTTATISRSVSNTVSLVSTLERNYSNT